MRLKVYSNPDPNPNDNPTQVRSSSVDYTKKAISYFMPNRLMYWNEPANPPVDNPTKSIPVNALIKRVKNKGVRKQGNLFQDQKPFTEHVYEAAIQNMDRHENFDVRIFVSSIFRPQMMIICRNQRLFQAPV